MRVRSQEKGGMPVYLDLHNSLDRLVLANNPLSDLLVADEGLSINVLAVNFDISGTNSTYCYSGPLWTMGSVKTVTLK